MWPKRDPLHGIQCSRGQAEKFLDYSPHYILLMNTSLFKKQGILRVILGAEYSLELDRTSFKFWPCQ